MHIRRSNNLTHIGVWYILSKSRPLRFALINVGPNAGTRNRVARSANIENPTDVYSAGSDGTGSRNGRITNHAATGMSEISRILGRGRGVRAALVIGPAIAVSMLEKLIAVKCNVQRVRQLALIMSSRRPWSRLSLVVVFLKDLKCCRRVVSDHTCLIRTLTCTTWTHKVLNHKESLNI